MPSKPSIENIIIKLKKVIVEIEEYEKFEGISTGSSVQMLEELIGEIEDAK